MTQILAHLNGCYDSAAFLMLQFPCTEEPLTAAHRTRVPFGLA